MSVINRIDCDYCNSIIDINTAHEKFCIERVLTDKKEFIDTSRINCNCNVTKIKETSNITLILPGTLLSVSEQYLRKKLYNLDQLFEEIKDAKELSIKIKLLTLNKNLHLDLSEDKTKHFIRKIKECITNHPKKIHLNTNFDFYIEVNQIVNEENEIKDIDIHFKAKLNSNYAVKKYQDWMQFYDPINKSRPESVKFCTYATTYRDKYKVGSCISSLDGRLTDLHNYKKKYNYSTYPFQFEKYHESKNKVFVQYFDDPISPFVFEQYLSKVFSELSLLGNHMFDDCSGIFIDKDKYKRPIEKRWHINVFLHRDENLFKDIYIEVDEDFYLKYFKNNFTNNISYERETIYHWQPMKNLLMDMNIYIPNHVDEFHTMLLKYPIAGFEIEKIKSLEREKLEKTKNEHALAEKDTDFKKKDIKKTLVWITIIFIVLIFSVNETVTFLGHSWSDLKNAT